MHTAVRSLALALLFSPLSQADVLTVDNDGSADFVSIGDAYAAAADGDVLLLRFSSLSQNHLVMDSKAVSIVAEIPYVSLGFLTIRNISASSVVLLSGLSLNNSNVRVEDCAGSIRFDGCVLRSPIISDSASVILSRCAVYGWDADALLQDVGGHGLHSLDSSVALFDCLLEGGAGSDGAGTFGGNGCPTAGGPALLIDRGKAYAMNCVFRGGDGGAAVVAGCSSGASDGAGVVSLGSAQLFMTDIPFMSPSSASIQFLGQPRREIELPSVVGEGDSDTWDFIGRPGDRVFLASSPLGDWRYLQSARGVLALAFAGPPSVSFMGVIGASSTLQVPMAATTLPAGSESIVVQHQIFVITADGERVLGQVSPQLVLQAGL
jgi:hypothetical protein